PKSKSPNSPLPQPPDTNCSKTSLMRITCVTRTPWILTWRKQHDHRHQPATGTHRAWVGSDVRRPQVPSSAYGRGRTTLTAGCRDGPSEELLPARTGHRGH